MPKQVDHEARRTRIATALWRVAEARGLDRVSLREVATEAGISLGQLQHYFANREEMLLFAMRFIGRRNVERTTERIMALGDSGPRVRLRAIVREMLPIDDKAEAGSLMNLSFLLEAARNETLGEFARQRVLALRHLLEGQLALAIQSGDIDAAREPRTEATLLISLADGLRTNVHLGVHTAGEAVGLMDEHLARLLADPAP